MSKNIIDRFSNNNYILEKIRNRIKAEDVFKNPYLLAEFISIEDIEKVINNDKIFKKMDFQNFRVRAYILEYANIQFKSNNTAFKKKELVLYIRAKTNNEIDEVFINESIKYLIENNIYIKEVNSEILTNEYFYEIERYIYDTIVNNIKIEKGQILKESELEYYMNENEVAQGFKYAVKQRDILRQINKRRNISFLNGYAGTGKTTTAKGILDLYSKILNKDDIVCAAFSGVAASRIKQATGYNAITVHSLLSYDGEVFNKNINNKTNYKLIVIDESGMIDSMLFSVLLSSIDFRNTEIIFLGDLGQIQSVGNGDCFRDIIVNEIAKDVIVLDKIYRQKEEQAINLIAQSIRKGIIPDYLKKYDDFEFIHSLGDNILEDMKKCILNVKSSLDAFMKECDYEEYINYFQIISPIKKSDYGVDALNLFAQKLLNDNHKNNSCMKIEFENKIILEKDKVMHLQNRVMKIMSYEDFENNKINANTDERKVMNGQVGIVVKITNDSRNKVYVYYPTDNFIAIYTELDIKRFKLLDLGYALTIHKAQGSQMKSILMPIVSRFKIMLNAQLLYTAVTRAKDMLTIIGEKTAFEYGATNINKNRRITVLDNIVK